MTQSAPSPTPARTPAHTTSDIYPSLCYDDAPGAITWLCRAFGFRQRLVVPGPNNTVMHSELSIGNGVIMVSSPHPERNYVSPRKQSGISQALCVRIEAIDAHYNQAKAAGAKVTRELRDEEYGSRGYMCTDLEGHEWYFGTYRPGEHWTA